MCRIIQFPLKYIPVTNNIEQDDEIEKMYENFYSDLVQVDEFLNAPYPVYNSIKFNGRGV